MGRNQFLKVLYSSDKSAPIRGLRQNLCREHPQVFSFSVHGQASRPSSSRFLPETLTRSSIVARKFKTQPRQTCQVDSLPNMGFRYFISYVLRDCSASTGTRDRFPKRCRRNPSLSGFRHSFARFHRSRLAPMGRPDLVLGCLAVGGSKPRRTHASVSEIVSIRIECSMACNRRSLGSAGLHKGGMLGQGLHGKGFDTVFGDCAMKVEFLTHRALGIYAPDVITPSALHATSCETDVGFIRSGTCDLV